MGRIVSIGEVLWDLFPDGPRFGGAPANFACHAAILGAQVSMVSAVGNDDRGHEAIRRLAAYGVDTSLIQTTPRAPTGAVEVTLSAAGKPTFAIQEPSAWDYIDGSTQLDASVTVADAIYVGTLGQRSAMSRATIHQALNLAKDKGIHRVLDVNLRKPFHDARLIRDSIRQASVLKLSDDELTEVASACNIVNGHDPHATLRALLNQYHLDLVAMTRGEHGASLVSRNETIEQPGIATIVLDTVGAGDSFTAALVVGLLRGDPLPDIALAACTLAAKVCAQSGAMPAL